MNIENTDNNGKNHRSHEFHTVKQRGIHSVFLLWHIFNPKYGPSRFKSSQLWFNCKGKKNKIKDSV